MNAKSKLLRLLLLLVLPLLATPGCAQDVVTVGQAVEMFAARDSVKAKSLMAAQGYAYKGVTGFENKSHTWCKRVDLTNDFVPTRFEPGTSSIVEMDQGTGAVSVYVFNRAAFDALRAEARQLGYEADKKGDFFYKEDAPYIMFLELGKPFPYLMQVSE